VKVHLETQQTTAIIGQWNTIVVNLFGGPGAGKSSTAAQLFASLKQKQAHVELVKEYVKDWAWGQRIVGPLDQPLIAGKQMHRESSLYGKVDVVVTDSPFLLSGYYQRLGGKDYLLPALLGFKSHAEELGVTYRNFFIKRSKPYDSRGRYQTAEESQEIDGGLMLYLKELGVDFRYVSGDAQEATAEIIQHLNL